MKELKIKTNFTIQYKIIQNMKDTIINLRDLNARAGNNSNEQNYILEDQQLITMRKDREGFL